MGRYYADHAFINAGTFVAADPERPMDFYFPATPSDGGHEVVRGAISLKRGIVEREEILNSVVFFRPPYEAHPAFDTPAVHALLEAWEKVRGRGVPGGMWPLLRRAARRPDAVAVALWRRLAVRSAGGRWPLRASLDCEPGRRTP